MDAAAFWTRTPLTAEEAAETDRVYGALAAATRAFGDAQLRTTVDFAEAEAVTAELERLTERLRARAIAGSHGTSLGPGPDEIRDLGNAAIGLRSPIAPVQRDSRSVADGKVVYEVRLGAVHEGPPGLVHGGVSALILDELLGEAAALAGGPGMTGRLTVQYRRPTPLGPLRVEGWAESVSGRKTVARARVLTADGTVTVEAEGLFIRPRWVDESEELARSRVTLE